MNKVGRKTGFKHSDATIERMKNTKAETNQRKNEIDIRLDFLKNHLYSISKKNHKEAIDLLSQFDKILKNDKKDIEILETLQQTSQVIEYSQNFLSNDEAFANLDSLFIDDNKDEE